MSASERSWGLTPSRENAAHCFDELGASPVVERDPELESIEMRGLGLELRHLLLQIGRDAVASPEEARAHALLREVGKLALDRLVQELHDRLDLVGRTRPVLRRERVDGERVDLEIDRRLDRPPQRSRSFSVTVGDGEAREPSPSARSRP